MSIGTGGGGHSSQLSLDAIGMSKFFYIIVTAEDVTRHKPNPYTFLNGLYK